MVVYNCASLWLRGFLLDIHQSFTIMAVENPLSVLHYLEIEDHLFSLEWKLITINGVMPCLSLKVCRLSEDSICLPDHTGDSGFCPIIVMNLDMFFNLAESQFLQHK